MEQGSTAVGQPMSTPASSSDCNQRWSIAKTDPTDLPDGFINLGLTLTATDRRGPSLSGTDAAPCRRGGKPRRSPPRGDRIPTGSPRLEQWFDRQLFIQQPINSKPINRQPIDWQRSDRPRSHYKRPRRESVYG